jgi:CheY-like chemotaxis protein
MGLRVLVVDDESDIREAIAELLCDEGYEVEEAGNGEEALVKAREHHPGLVLLDLMMPGMSGWEFRSRQRSDPELAAIPVVVLTAVGRTAGVEGVTAYLSKPFELGDLLTMIRRYAQDA